MIIRASSEQLEELDRTILLMTPLFVRYRLGTVRFLRILSSSRSRAFDVLVALLEEAIKEDEEMRGVLSRAEGSNTTLLLIEGRGRDEHAIAHGLYQKGISAYALTHTTLISFLPVNLQLFLDPEVPEDVGALASRFGRVARRLAQVSNRLERLNVERRRAEKRRDSRTVKKLDEEIATLSKERDDLITSLQNLKAELKDSLKKLGIGDLTSLPEKGRVRVEVCGTSMEFELGGDLHVSSRKIARALSWRDSSEVEALVIDAVDRAVREGRVEVALPVSIIAGCRHDRVGFMVHIRDSILDTRTIGIGEDMRASLISLLGWEGRSDDEVEKGVERAIRSVIDALGSRQARVGRPVTVELEGLKARAVITYEAKAKGANEETSGGP
ncbi:MAG: hypothetical protein QXP93_07085 [Nitrososphaerota archaeon]